MITRIREVRKTRGMTLDDVARACKPATTAQTIGRLETGTRTVSVGWLNRIADALGVDASELVAGAGGSDINVDAILGAGGQARAPKRTALLVPPKPGSRTIGMTVSASVGEYRAGDEIWCDPLEPTDYVRALNRDVLIPRPAGRFLFGRLIDRDGGRLLILPPGAGGRQQIVADPPWIAVAAKLIRAL
ncbi:helix-turn-helix transcriptional regulator [Sphingomonas sp. HDW15A]|uniref:helix-turn-helix domain-containing protein n=1 Tax=Sphingomonas sp. HDW15A TaxID=2714942 RepID=UPI00140AC438|nr:helix-turn-helix transcriptional regulator [Sphingomonas sp. HDW15A]QIK96346.1 helix-turn-helix transcriptional regulator [Sphingomonas sp. HDW15A]